MKMMNGLRAFAALAIMSLGLMVAGCGDDEPQTPNGGNQTKPETPTDTVKPETPTDTVKPEPESKRFFIKVMFEDNDGGDFLDPSHERTLVGSKIQYRELNDPLPFGVSWDNKDEYNVDDAGHFYIPLTANVFERSEGTIDLSWADSYHAETIDFRAEGDGWMIRPGGEENEFVPLETGITFRTYPADHPAATLLPLSIVFDLVDGEGKSLLTDSADIPVTILDLGATYNLSNESTGEIFIPDNMKTGGFFDYKPFRFRGPETTFSGLRYADKIYDFDGDDITERVGHRLIAFGDYDRTLRQDFFITVKVGKDDDLRTFVIRMVNDVKWVADGPEAKQTFYVDGVEQDILFNSAGANGYLRLPIR